ncbi:MAG: helix-turn-helix domain-containing protein [Bacteroidales bacterium]|nr:helix-turn-helix domain-containing protein [Candidatus Cryptobacteroides aphodequi]
MKRFLSIAVLCAAALLPAARICYATVAPAPSFSRISVEQGLSHTTANDIFTDSLGVVWIATKDGLNRYDGRSVNVFRPSSQQGGTILNNVISSVTGNGADTLYMVIADNVGCLDTSTGVFSYFRCPCINAITFRESLYVAALENIYTMDGEGNFSLYTSLEMGQAVTSLRFTGDSLWIGTRQNGVYLKEPGSGPRKVLDAGKIADLYVDSEGNVWACTWTEGLFRISKDGTTTNFRYNTDSARSLSSNFVRSCCEDEEGNLWVGTIKGLDRIGPDGTVAHFRSDQRNPYSLGSDSVWKIRRDRQGTLWVATYYGGVNYFNPQRELFTSYLPSVSPEEGLVNPIVGEMCEDSEGNLWIGTEGGLNYLDRTSGRFTRFQLKDKRSGVEAEHIKALYLDEESRTLWVGADLAGLFSYSLDTGTTTGYFHIDGDPATIPGNRVRDIVPYVNDTIIVATQSGICLFDTASGKARNLFKDRKYIKVITTLLLDSDGILWFSEGGSGLSRYDIASGRLSFYGGDTAPGKFVSAIFRDSSGRLWIGTGDSGFFLFEGESETFRTFDKSNSALASDCINSIKELPGGGKLVLATSAGFTIFEPDSGYMRNLGRESGFPFPSTYENALCVTHDGDVFIGSTQGMASFSAENLFRTPGRFDILFASASVGGEQEIRCPALLTARRGDHVSISLAVTNYVSSDLVSLEYTLDEHSGVWTPVGEDYNLRLQLRNTGTSTLTVRAKGVDESVCPYARMILKVKWRPFVLSYIILFALIAVLAPVLYLRREKEAAEEEEEEDSYSIMTQHLYDKAKAVVEANLANTSFGISEFCSEMGMSRTVLFSKIKEVSGQTPNDFILSIRLDKAAHMLKHNLDWSVADISEKTGFKSASYFSQKFKDCYHMPPLSFRKRSLSK